MYRILIILCLGTLVISISSCRIQNTRFFNSPSAHAPAYLEKKGDSKISANIAFMPKEEYSEFDFPFDPSGTRESQSIGFDVNTAYAFSDRFMATVGGLYRRETDAFSYNDILQTTTSSENIYTRKALDIGFGALIPLNERKIVVFNPIIGVNFGRSESFYNNTCDTINDNREFHFHGNYHKFYLKPNFNFRFHRNFKMNVVPQVSFMKYRNIDNNYPQDILDFSRLDSFGKRNLFLFEPATFYQIGFDKVDWLKLDLGLALSFYKFTKNSPIKMRTRNLQVSAGFSIYP